MSAESWSAEQYLIFGSTRPSFGRAKEFVVGLLLLLTITVFVHGWYAPSFAKWIPLGVLGIFCWGCFLVFLLNDTKKADLLDGFSIALFLWAAISLRWSADPSTGVDTLIHWSALLGVFLYLRRAMSNSQILILGWVAFVGALVVLGFVFFNIGHFGGYYNTNLITEMLLALVPLMYPTAMHYKGSRQIWYFYAAAFVIATYVLFLNESKIGIAVWGGLAMFHVSSFFFSQSKRKGLMSILVFLFSGVVMVILGWERLSLVDKKGFAPSFLPRIEYAINTYSVWLTSPLKGVGAGGFNSIFALHQEDHSKLMNVNPDEGKLNSLFETAGAAHNDILQFVASYGLIGLGIVIAGFWIARYWFKQWKTTPTRAAGISVLISVLINSLLEFPLQMPATLLLFTIGLAWFLPLADSSEVRQAAPHKLVLEARIFLGALATTSMIAIGWWVWNYFPAQQSFAKTLAIIYSEPQKALAYNEDAINRYPFDDMFRRQYLITLMRWDETAGTRVIPPEGYDKVFEITNSVGPVTGTLILRLQYLLQSGRYLSLVDETKRWRDLLRSQSPRIPDIWLLEGVFAAQIGDRLGVEAALARYQILTNGKTPENRKMVVASLQSDLKRLEASSSK